MRIFLAILFFATSLVADDSIQKAIDSGVKYLLKNQNLMVLGVHLGEQSL